jgi:hypothetical protein
MKANILLIAGIFFLNSCANLVGFYSDYEKLSKDDKEKIVFLDSNYDICDLKKEGKIYAVTGTQLRKCIETKDSVMIYKWVPHCKSEFCYSLSYVQKYCDSNNLLLFVVMDYYASNRMFIEMENISQPLFSINERYYKKRIRSGYSKRFMRDLLNDKKLFKEIWWQTSFIFNNGKLISSRINMED